MNKPIHGGNLIWAAAVANRPISSILDFSASINPLGMPQTALEAIAANVAHLSAYPDPNYTRLHEAIAQFHNLDPSWILAGNGSAELLTWAARDLASSSIVHLITPAFSDYYRALRAFDGKIASLPLDLTRLALIIPQNVPHNAGIIINNPHNPTGKLWRREEIVPFLELYNLVVIDEAFMDFLPPDRDQSVIDLVADYPNLIVLRSLTKFYSLAGLRIGYAITNNPKNQKLTQWQKWRDPWSVNHLADRATIAILQDREFQEKTRSWLEPTKLNLFDNLRSIEGLQPLPSSANFLLVKTQFSSSQLQLDLLQKEGILIRDCLSFPELGDNYFRVAVRKEEENQRLIAAIRQLQHLSKR